MPNLLGQIVRRFSLRESLVFVFFLLLAGLIWYGHAMNSVRSASLPVKITYRGIPDDILFSDTLPDVIYIEVRDAGRRLKAYGHSLELSPDLSSQIKGDNGNVVVPADLLRNGITTILQGTTKLQTVTPEQISGSYYRQQSKKVSVHLQATATPATQYQLLGAPEIQPDRVMIYGKQEQLDTIAFVNTEQLIVADIKDTVEATVSLAVPAGVRVTEKDIQVTYTAEQFTEKELLLPIKTHHVPSGTHLRLFPSEVAVYLRVGVEHFNEIREQDIEVYCDYPQAPADKLTLKVRCDNPFVTCTRCNPASVEFLIEK
jgi:hypothetical protein